jgi:hypothetical protein
VARNQGFTIYLLGSTKVDSKEYTMADVKPGSMKPPTSHGLSDAFYGGRCKYVGLTNTDVHVVIEDNGGLRVIDTFVTKVDNLGIRTLKAIADRHGIDVPPDCKTKDAFIQLLSGRITARAAEAPKVERIE